MFKPIKSTKNLPKTPPHTNQKKHPRKLAPKTPAKRHLQSKPQQFQPLSSLTPPLQPKTISTRFMSTAPSVTSRLDEVRKQLHDACEQYKRPTNSVSLLAVSKTHPPIAITEAYDHGQRAFGENYVHELVEKAPLLPNDIQWHFIGGLQSNKAKFLAQIPNLTLVESIDSTKLASKLNSELIKVGRADPLGILIQVNTSDEEQKGGIEPSECLEMVQFILQNCPRLKFKGLMTIGKIIDENNPTAAPYFETLTKCRDEICTKFENITKDSFILSMGMTHDFETAIQYGSTEIRVGTAIFGDRNYGPKPVKVDQVVDAPPHETEENKTQ
jgi:pyridoxal phosphate enzyme (YggS family)